MSSPPIRFAVDRSLGRLARWLRLLRFDAVCRPDLDRHAVETLAAREGRILVTRAARPAPEVRAPTLVLASDRFRDQLREIDRVHPLGGRETRSPRCLRCNVELAGIPDAERAAAGAASTAPGAANPEGGPSRCPRCRRRYDAGGHTERMEAELERLSLRLPGTV